MPLDEFDYDPLAWPPLGDESGTSLHMTERERVEIKRVLENCKQPGFIASIAQDRAYSMEELIAKFSIDPSVFLSLSDVLMGEGILVPCGRAEFLFCVASLERAR